MWVNCKGYYNTLFCTLLPDNTFIVERVCVTLVNVCNMHDTGHMWQSAIRVLSPVDRSAGRDVYERRRVLGVGPASPGLCAGSGRLLPTSLLSVWTHISVRVHTTQVTSVVPYAYNSKPKTRIRDRACPFPLQNDLMLCPKGVIRGKVHST